MSQGEESIEGGGLVLLLEPMMGDAGIVDFLKQAGKPYKKKRLKSGPANWASIVDLFDSHEVTAVSMRLSLDAYFNFCHPEYEDVAKRLLDLISSVPNLVVVHEDLFSCGETADPDDDWADLYARITPEVRDLVHPLFYLRGMELVTYRKNAEVTVLTTDFLRESDSKLLFRTYVPKAQLYAEETDRVIRLFCDYLSSVAGVSAKLEVKQTPSGSFYEVRAELEEAVDVESHYRNFSDLASLSEAAPEKAAEVLALASVNSAKASRLVEKYGREVRRLRLDMQQERERRLLAIRHRLEQELAEEQTPDGREIEMLVDDAFRQPFVGDLEKLTSIGSGVRSMPLRSAPMVSNERAREIIYDELSGEAGIAEAGQQFRQLIARQGGKEREALLVSLRELEDAALPAGDKKPAERKLKTFLLSSAGVVGKASVDLLKDYLKSRLGF
ncbi:hypothetical protein [Alienimonas chondri]|uniref:Uncharacterized protein n=1 Tax=Alienimonas chondri TaxID=2681879 RepID=A0ABX1V9G0_9PLAN|nr:hypothetical protein [Alienimonas chondri]NNJ24096.1 hypothetical protein [Alienimonas chondri]